MLTCIQFINVKCQYIYNSHGDHDINNLHVVMTFLHVYITNSHVDINFSVMYHHNMYPIMYLDVVSRPNRNRWTFWPVFCFNSICKKKKETVPNV